MNNSNLNIHVQKVISLCEDKIEQHIQRVQTNLDTAIRSLVEKRKNSRFRKTISYEKAKKIIIENSKNSANIEAYRIMIQVEYIKLIKRAAENAASLSISSINLSLEDFNRIN